MPVELERLGHKSTRMEAVTRLGEAGDVAAVEPLLHACRRVKREQRAAVARALALIGAPAVEILIRQGLEHPKSAAVRRCAARALGLIGPEARPAVEALCKRLKEDSLRVRLEAIDALGQIRDQTAGPALAALLDDEEDSVVEHATVALGALGEGALPAVEQVFVESKSGRARAAAALALGQIGGERAVARLRAALAEGKRSTRFRVAALSALRQALGDEALPIAEAALADENSRVRHQAVRLLREIDTPASTALLLRLCDDKDEKVRDLALEGLGGRATALLARLGAGEREVLPALLAVWRSMGQADEGQAHALARALVEMGPVVVPALVTALDDEQPAADVIDVLAEIGPAAGGAYEALVAMLDHPDRGTSQAAACALGALGDRRAIPVLAARLSFAPLQFKGKRAFKHAMALQDGAAAGLGALGRDALPAAVEAAESEDPIARRGGVLALGYIGGGRALALLERATEDEDAGVREAAAQALERLAGHDVLRLERMLASEDERVRLRAVEALGRLEDLRSLDLLLRAYGDPSPPVSEAVVEALARREGPRATSILMAAAAGGNVVAVRALQEHPVPQAVPALLEALDSPWQEVYEAALETLGTFARTFDGEPETMAALRQALPQVLSFLHDPSAKTRRTALYALGCLGQAEAVPEIAPLLQDEKTSVRLAAVHALAQIGGTEAEAALYSQMEVAADEDMRAEIADVLEV